MDKIILTQEEVKQLFTWKDNHKDLVRQNLAPFQAIEIRLPEIQLILKAIHKGNKLHLHLNLSGKPSGNADFIVQPPNCIKTKSTIASELIPDLLTLYCALMALIVYAEHPKKEASQQDERRKKGSAASKTRTRNITHLLQVCYPKTETSSHHASPTKPFTVRGHYRHYRNGKVIWIAEYRKGEGKRRNKTYKL